MTVKTLSKTDPMRWEPCPNNTSGGWHQWHYNGLVMAMSGKDYEDWSCQLCGETRLREKTDD